MVAICNGRFTSTPTVPFAQAPDIRRWLGERIKSTRKATFKFDAMNGWKARDGGLRLKAQAAPEAAVLSSWGDRVNTTLPDGTPREGWRGLPIRNAIQRACILRGRARK